MPPYLPPRSPVPSRALDAERTVMTFTSTRLGLIVLATLAVGSQQACDSVPTQPESGIRAPVAPPLLSLDPAPIATTLGPWQIPIAPTNTYGEGELGWTLTGLKLPSFTAYVVKVQGRVSVGSNPDVVSCYPDHQPPYGAEGSYGPGGTGWYDQLRVTTSFATPSYWDNVPLYGATVGREGSSDAVSDTLFAWNDGEVAVFRKGILHGIGGGPNNCPGMGFYTFASGQTITVTKLDGQELRIRPKQVLVKKGTVVRFTATTSDGTVIGTPNWRFIPASSLVPNETGDCGIQGPNPCDLRINNDGEYRVSRYINWRMRGDGAKVRIYHTFGLVSDKSSVSHGDTVAFTPLIDDLPGFAVRWRWRAEDSTEVAEPCPVIVDHKCPFAPASTGTMWAYTSTRPDEGDSASVRVEVKPIVPPPDECGRTTTVVPSQRTSGGARLGSQPPTCQQAAVTIVITTAAGPNEAGSFTTRAPENRISLQAEVAPADLASQVEWEVTDFAGDEVATPLPSGAPSGATSGFVIPVRRMDTERWPATHDGRDVAPFRKTALAYQVVALVTVNGKTTRSAPKVIAQDAFDTVRQEYIDYDKQEVPDRSEFVTTGSVARNTGDYAFWPSSAKLRFELPILLDILGWYWQKEPTITGGFRNPVHHHKHVARTGPAATESAHLYGGAVDFRVRDHPSTTTRRDYFLSINHFAKRTTYACVEPEDVIIRTSPLNTPANRHPADPNDDIRLDHAHAHWAATCAKGW